MLKIFSLFQQGGLVMYPLLICSIAAVAILINRIQVYRKAQSDIDSLSATLPALAEKQEWNKIIEVCKADGGMAATVIAQAATQEASVQQQEKALEGAAISAAGKFGPI